MGSIDLDVTEEFNTKTGKITAELYDEGVIKFYREEEDEPYREEEFDDYDEAEEEFFSLDSQVIEKHYLPKTEKYYTVETTVFHTVKAESNEEAIEKVGRMDADTFMDDMESPESIVVDIEEE